MPWAELQALLESYYSKGELGRKPVGLEIMLRVYFLQQWFALSDPGVEDGQMLDTVNFYLGSRGIRITTGTTVDATIIHAPSSTKNEK